MKVALFILASVIAAVSGQSEGWCRCAAFVTYEHSEIMVFDAPEIPIDSCENVNSCKTKCADELNTISDNGNLYFETESGITVGQSICTYMAEHFFFFISSKNVYGYYEVCGGAWQYSGVQSQQRLCCQGGEQHYCVGKLV